jgi:hypothetical protein
MVERTPIDPTTNVLDLVRAESKYQDAMRDAEATRINDLAALRVYYDGIIEAMRSDSLKLLAEQLKENKAESGGRTALLEQFRWESGGKSQGAGAIWGYVFGTLGLLIALGTLLVLAFEHGH